MTPDELTRVSDDELYALEQQRALDSRSLDAIDAELQRRKRNRRAALADLPALPTDAPTLGDLERASRGLHASIDAHVATVDARLRSLRRWVLLAPVGWTLIAVSAWLALRAWAPEVLRELSRMP